MKTNLRWALDADGPRVAELATACGLVFEGFEIDWSRLEPYWLVAEINDIVVAAIQVLPAFPIGRIDYLLVDPTLSKRTRAVAVKRITDHGTALLRLSGCQIAGSEISQKRNDDYLRVAIRRGWVVLSKTYSIVKRLR
jgi:hypothetical protein